MNYGKTNRQILPLFGCPPPLSKSLGLRHPYTGPDDQGRVASLSVPGEQEFHFPHFSSNFIIFSYFSSNFPKFYPHSGPGKALATPLPTTDNIRTEACIKNKQTNKQNKNIIFFLYQFTRQKSSRTSRSPFDFTRILFSRSHHVCCSCVTVSILIFRNTLNLNLCK